MMIEVISMACLLVFILCYAWHKTGSLWKAFIIMLIVGKVITAVYWAFGYDRVLFTISLINRKTGMVISQYKVSACMIVFLSFLFTLIGTLTVPYLIKYLPREIRSSLRAFEVRG